MDQDSFFFPQTGGWLLGFPQLGFSKKKFSSPDPFSVLIIDRSFDQSHLGTSWVLHDRDPDHGG
jgi:hypothetical protein